MTTPIRRSSATLCASLLFAAAASAADAPTTNADGWTKLAENVFQRSDFDGSTTRLSYGTAGARYERSVLQARLAPLANKVANGAASSADRSALKDLQARLAAIPTRADSAIVPMTVSSGIVCSRYHYDLDAQLIVGKAGATAVGRANLTTDGVGPPPPLLSSVTEYAEGSITPAGGSALTVTKSNTMSNTYGAPIPAAISDWEKSSYTSVGTSDCTGYAYASISASGGACTGSGGFVYVSKTFSTCATSP